MQSQKRRKFRRKNKNSISEGNLWLTVYVVFILTVESIALYSDKAFSYVEDIDSQNTNSSLRITEELLYKASRIDRNPGSSAERNKQYRKTRYDFSDEIEEASRKYGISANLIKAVIQAESNFNPNAISPKGAMGLMQLMPQTAMRFNVTDPFNPSQNINGGTRYLKILLSQFNDNRRLALAAYNAGEGTVMKFGDVPPYKETIFYVRKVIESFRNLEENDSNNG